MNVLQILAQRGFIENQTHEKELEAHLEEGGRPLLHWV